jgi:peptidyl-prolyl cis-trans isomerase B (cyclophilin B)
MVLALGCGGGRPEVADEKPKEPAKGSEGTPTPAVSQAAHAKPDPFLYQPFAEATVPDAPDGQELPAQTMTGKSVGKLYTQVVELWDQVRFVSPAGKRLKYSATLQTRLGPIEIELRPDIAPNHVRSFVALARAGYYDGLVFERTVHEESDAKDGVSLDYIEAGCPLGTGHPSYGSIGYWLRPELSDKVRHEEGTVGAWHVEEADSAACKFYITLTKAPVMDGNWTVFGKVTRGLEVARQIARRPVREDEFKDRPREPVVIDKVTVHTQEVDR